MKNKITLLHLLNYSSIMLWPWLGCCQMAVSRTMVVSIMKMKEKEGKIKWELKKIFWFYHITNIKRTKKKISNRYITIKLFSIYDFTYKLIRSLSSLAPRMVHGCLKNYIKRKKWLLERIFLIYTFKHRPYKKISKNIYYWFTYLFTSTFL